MGRKKKKKIDWPSALIGFLFGLVLLLLGLLLSEFIIPYWKGLRDRPATAIWGTVSESAERDASYYRMLVVNTGNGMDRKIHVRFILTHPGILKTIKVLNPDRAKLARKARRSVEFAIEELFPSEWQQIDIEATGRGEIDVEGWSEITKKIKSISWTPVKRWIGDRPDSGTILYDKPPESVIIDLRKLGLWLLF